MKNFLIIDNFMEQEYFKKVFNLLIKLNNFTWVYSDTVADDLDNEGFYFVHTFFENNLSHSEHFENIITPLVQKFLNTTKINKCTLVRAKANLFIKSVVNFKNNLHKDQDNKNYVNLIYYVNNNNGYTEFEDGTKINSVANRALIFDNNILHRSVNQTDEKVRINFNLNITPNIFLK